MHLKKGLRGVLIILSLSAYYSLLLLSHYFDIPKFLQQYSKEDDNENNENNKNSDDNNDSNQEKAGPFNPEVTRVFYKRFPHHLKTERGKREVKEEPAREEGQEGRQFGEEAGCCRGGCVD